MKELICIGCPMGCTIQLDLDQGKVAAIRGSACKRGEQYARDEILQPKRMVTSLIPVDGSLVPLSVRTRSAIPKHLIGSCLEAIRQTKVDLPVHTGDVIISNLFDTGIDLIATRDLPEIIEDN